MPRSTLRAPDDARPGVRGAVSPAVFDLAVVNYNTAPYLLELLCSIEDRLPADRIGDVHVWDNGSTDESRRMLDRLTDRPNLRVHRSAANVHHGPALDALLREHCSAPWVLVLDSDTRILGDFTGELELTAEDPPAFVGQIHPLMNHLYAYLAHLLVNRDWYRRLPAFFDDGAPGRAYFSAVEERGIPYRRFRWSDWIEHAGQATLRGLVDRAEEDHPLYAFALREARESPAEADRRRHEQVLRQRLDDFLGGTAPASSTPVRRAEPRSGHNGNQGDLEPPTPSIRRPSPLSPIRELAALRTPRIALWLARARRIGLVQKRWEALEIARFVRRLRPRSVLEIGTARGGSLYLWTRCARADATLVSVDLPPWELDDPWEPAIAAKLRGMARRDQRLHLLRRSSHDVETRREVEALLPAGTVDFLFLDGDHSFEGVMQDHAWYRPLVRPGGWIAFHDIHPHSRGWGGEVPRAWSEISEGLPSRVLIESQGQDGFGIGLLQVPEESSPGT